MSRAVRRAGGGELGGKGGGPGPGRGEARRSLVVRERLVFSLLLVLSASVHCATHGGAGPVRSGPGAGEPSAADLELPEYGLVDQEEDRRAYRQLIVRLADVRPGQVIADIGSSYGFYVDALAPLLGPQGRYYATDIDPRVVDHLRRYRSFVPILVPRLARAPRDTALDDLGPESVDVILMIDSVVFSRPATAEARRADVDYLARLNRVLKTTGRLIHRVAWLSPAHLDKGQVVDLFRAAGFSADHDDVVVPDHVPPRFRSPDGTVAERGFLLVFRAGPWIADHAASRSRTSTPSGPARPPAGGLRSASRRRAPGVRPWRARLARAEPPWTTARARGQSASARW